MRRWSNVLLGGVACGLLAVGLSLPREPNQPQEPAQSAAPKRDVMSAAAPMAAPSSAVEAAVAYLADVDGVVGHRVTDGNHIWIAMASPLVENYQAILETAAHTANLKAGVTANAYLISAEDLPRAPQARPVCWAIARDGKLGLSGCPK